MKRNGFEFLEQVSPVGYTYWVPLLIRFVARASEKGFRKVEEGALFGAASVSAVTRRSVSDLGSESIAQPRSTQGKAFECDAWASLSQRGHRVDGFKSCVWTMRTIGALCTRSEIYLPGPDAVGMLPYFTTGSRFLKDTSINSLSWRGRAKKTFARRA
jgi:hypothetical protein